MHGRGCSKRHTVGCTDDLSTSANPNDSTTEQSLSHSPAPSTSGRTRRTGLLTVMERPPGRQYIFYIFSHVVVVAWTNLNRYRLRLIEQNAALYVEFCYFLRVSLDVKKWDGR